MASFDKESMIFEWIQLVPQGKVCLLTQSESEEAIYQSLHCTDHWVNNSADTNNPPDYYNDVDGYMMDFMRTNDYEKRKGSKKVKNHIAAKENQMMKKLRDSGILDAFPNVKNMFLMPNDNIQPSLKLYFDNSKRVLEEHNAQISVYRANHPNLKTIFCVCDLSEHEHKMWAENNPEEIMVYHPCFNKDLLKIIKSLDVEFVLWFRPYLMPTTNSPQIVIIDVEKLNPDMFPDMRETSL